MLQVRDNTEKQRFEIEVEVPSGDGNGSGAAVAFADYRVKGNVVSVTHVFTPPELRGQGIAGKLMDGIVEIIRTRGQKIAPICPYAVSWLNKHKEHSGLVS